MSIASIITRGYGTYGSVYDLTVRGYSNGVIQIDTCEMIMTCGTFTAGVEVSKGGGGSMFVGFIRKILRNG